MKRIIFFSPVPLEKESSGISIRISELKSKLNALGIKTEIYDSLEKYIKRSSDYIYIMVSTKSKSISSRVVESFKGQDLIVDLYTPIFLEKEVSLSKWNPKNWLVKKQNQESVRKIISAAKFFLVANQRQKNYWIETAKSLNFAIKNDQIFVIPTGAPPLKIPEFKNKNVILWFGGIYPWMNPQSLVEAFSKIANKNKSWKLRILGGFHPKTGYQDIFKKVIEKAQKTIPEDSLEIISWQPSTNLPFFLKDVALAVHLPKDTDEDFFAHRVRLLTLLNGKIPVITSGRDTISDLIGKHEAGRKVDIKNLEAQLNEILNSEIILTKWRKNAPNIQKHFISMDSDLISLQKELTA